MCWRCDPQYDSSGHKSRKQVKKPRPKTVKTGKRSEYMPDELVDAYELVITDKEYTSLHEDIATDEARIRAELLKIKESPKSSTPFIKKLAEQLGAGKKLIRQGRKSPMTLLDEISATIHGAEAGVNVWENYDRIVEHKRKLVESETRRLVSLGWSPEMLELLIKDIAGILERLAADNTLSAAAFVDRLGKSKLFSGAVLRLAPAEETSLADPAAQLTALEVTRREINVTDRGAVVTSVDTQEVDQLLTLLEES